MSQFDELGRQPEYSKDQLAVFEKRDILIHKVFGETEPGRELLEIFVNELISTSSDVRGSDLFSLGKEEGIKTFMRNIISTIRKVEQ